MHIYIYICIYTCIYIYYELTQRAGPTLHESDRRHSCGLVRMSCSNPETFGPKLSGQVLMTSKFKISSGSLESQSHGLSQPRHALSRVYDPFSLRLNFQKVNPVRMARACCMPGSIRLAVRRLCISSVRRRGVRAEVHVALMTF